MSRKHNVFSGFRTFPLFGPPNPPLNEGTYCRLDSQPRWVVDVHDLQSAVLSCDKRVRAADCLRDIISGCCAVGSLKGRTTWRAHAVNPESIFPSTTKGAPAKNTNRVTVGLSCAKRSETDPVCGAAGEIINRKPIC